MEKIKLFISYCHDDVEYCNLLTRHLSTLASRGLISYWFDDNILPGKIWSDRIREELNCADIVILLISADFLSSNYCSVELNFALEKHRKKEGLAIPVIVRHCDWEETEISELQALPKFKSRLLPIKSWDDKDQAFLSIIESLKKIITEIRSRSEETNAGLADEEKTNKFQTNEKINLPETKSKSRILDLTKNLNKAKIFLFTFLIAIFILIFSWKDLFKKTTESSFNTPAVITPEKEKKLQDITDDLINTLITSEYKKKETRPDYYNVWTTSQIVVASQSKNTSIKADYLKYIYTAKQHVRSCNCWHEFDSANGYGNHVTTAWVVFALSDFDIRINDTLLNYILSEQSTDGWWSIYPGQFDKDASTQATAILALALKRTLSLVTDSSIKGKINFSIKNATKWLEIHANSRNGLWYDYPNSGERKETSIGLNGLILHALNEVETNKAILKDLNLRWLNSFDNYRKSLWDSTELKYDVLSSSSSGHSISIEYNGIRKSEKDAIVNYNLPWFIIANTDAIQYADQNSKNKILTFFNEIIDQANDSFNSAIKETPWLAAEFLVSLRSINKEDVLIDIKSK